MHPNLPRSLRALNRWTLAAALVVAAAASGLATTAASIVLAADPMVHHAYVVKVTNRGKYPDPDSTILSMIDTALDHWEVESNGRISSFDRVGGITEMEAATDCTEGGPMRAQAAKLFPDVDFTGQDGNLLIVVAPNECHGGEATIGWDLSSSGMMSFDYDPTKSPNTLMHEIGHTLSLEHAHGMLCDPACSDYAYGNRYDFMGISVHNDPAYVPPALDSYQRIWLEIADRCEIPAVRLPHGQRTSSTTYQLLPRGTDAGTRGLEVTDPVSGVPYFLDFRDAAGRDSEAYYPTTTASSSPGWFRPGVTVEKGIVDSQGYDIDSVLQAFTQPDGKIVYSKVAGESFRVGGLTIAVDSLGPVGDPTATATVTVTLTDPQGTRDVVADPSADPCAEEAAVDPPAGPGPSLSPAPSPSPAASPTMSPTQPAPTAPPSTTTASTPTPTPAPTPALPTVALPTLPPLTLPPVPLPSMTAPPVTLPPVALPTVALPPVTLPTPALPPVALPTGGAPTAPLPPVVLPTTSPAAPAPTPLPGVPTDPVGVPTALPTTVPTTADPTADPTAGPSAGPSAGSVDDPADDTVPRPGSSAAHHHGLPETGAPRLLLAEIAAAAFALTLGVFLLVAVRRQRPKRGSLPMNPSSLV